VYECPLKIAAREDPEEIAILSKEIALSFAQLDKYVDSIHEENLVVEAHPSLHTIALFFAAWRKEKSIFPTSPRLPVKPAGITAPPCSLLLYTSGSTKDPKIAVLTPMNLIANAMTAIPALDLRPRDQWRLTLPLYHVGGISIVIRCILARATIVLDDSPKITHLSCVPTQLYRATPIYKHLRLLLVGGAPIPNYPFPTSTTYGLTEMSSMVTLNGSSLPNRELKLNSDGEIFVQGPSLFQGYLGKAPQKGWFATGDLAHFEQGKLIIDGRKDWMFISGGENIQPEEIERHLLSLPEVVEAVVVGKNDPEFGKRPVAIVKALKKFSLEEMQAALSKHLPKFKIPIELHFFDQIPQKSDFKINRFILSQYINNQSLQNTSVQKKAPYL
jgi:O-succinylbenzoic acid--CoA ligase